MLFIRNKKLLHRGNFDGSELCRHGAKDTSQEVHKERMNKITLSPLLLFDP